jgi:hypothetical protein
MRLDALGLSVESVTKKAAELEAQGFVGDAFDEAVLIGLEEKMVLLGDASETSAGQMKVLESNAANAGDAIKSLVANANITQETIRRWADLSGGVADVTRLVGGAWADLDRAAAMGLITDTEAIALKMVLLTDRAADAKVVLFDLQDQMEELDGATVGADNSMKALNNRLMEQRNGTDKAASAWGTYTGALEKMYAAQGIAANKSGLQLRLSMEAQDKAAGELSAAFNTFPNALFSFELPIANSSQFSLPMIIASSSINLCKAVAEYKDSNPPKILEEQDTL